MASTAIRSTLKHPYFTGDSNDVHSKYTAATYYFKPLATKVSNGLKEVGTVYLTHTGSAYNNTLLATTRDPLFPDVTLCLDKEEAPVNWNFSSSVVTYPKYKVRIRNWDSFLGYLKYFYPESVYDSEVDWIYRQGVIFNGS